ncbi:MAG TPA: hypothetical protein VNT75_18900 [Symbiobacteriaceae bacterium]|nr:hypothetical protein [Symbiobacteriaceae bacterium]
MPYILLLTAGLGLLKLLRRADDAPWVVALLLLTGGAIGLGDLIFAAFFELYTYQPGFLPQPRDHYLGMLMGDKLFAPIYTAAILPSIADQPFPGILWAAGGLGLVEYLFLHLGVFVYWNWHLSYTVGAFLLFFFMAARWLQHFRKARYAPFHRLVLITGAGGFAFHLWGILAEILLDLYRLRPHWLVDSLQDRLLGGTVFFGLPFMAVSFIVVWFRKDRNWWILGAVGAGFTAWYSWLWQVGVWQDGVWQPYLEAAVNVLLVYLIGEIDRWMENAVPARQALKSGKG